MRAVKGIERGTRVCYGCIRAEPQAGQDPNSTRHLAFATTLLERLYITRCWRPISQDAALRLFSITVPLIRSLEAQNIGGAEASLFGPFRALAAGCCRTGTRLCTWRLARSSARAHARGTSRLDASKVNRKLEAKSTGCVPTLYSRCTTDDGSTTRANARYSEPCRP